MFLLWLAIEIIFYFFVWLLIVKIVFKKGFTIVII